MREVRHLQYVAFSSAGSHGFLYQGVLEALEDNVPEYDAWCSSLRGVAGTSAGAIVALIFALAVSREKRNAIFAYLSDISNIFQCPDVALMLSNFGFEDGSALRSIVRDILTYGGLSPTTTMADLRRLLKLEVVFVAHDLLSCRQVHLTASTAPQMLVYDAVFSSCALPLVFAPFKYGDALLCDGAMTESVPNVFPTASTLFVVVPPSKGNVHMSSWHDMMQCFSRVALAPQRARIDALMSLPNTLVAYHPLMDAVRTLDVKMDAKRAKAICHVGYVATLMYLHFDSVATALTIAVERHVHDGLTLTSSTPASPESEDEY